ncbi:MAG: hypothetical protein A3F10_00950 [Coxiella sp. RIFCSPHIGHO2_12_FULL_42_15]|nr:MAG: hypothetical protein A3F10_00950 [Coxiella sp. RIFCSPHIGHO2_12_FULL_42_15]
MLALFPQKSYSQKGITLIELLLALIIGLITIGAIVALFVLATTQSRKTIEIARLTSSLQLVLSSLERDLQRAGYWAQAETSAANPFMVTGSTDLTVNAANTCVLITYDANSDGLLPPIDATQDDERYGYRLQEGAIQFRPAGAPFECTAAQSSWTNLTDPKFITITAFSVVLNTETINLAGGTGTQNIQVRFVEASLTGQLVKDSAITKTLTEKIKVYNDKYES